MREIGTLEGDEDTKLRQLQKEYALLKHQLELSQRANRQLIKYINVISRS
jgi:hypothetical protein